MNARYYSTQRPLGPGTFPTPHGNHNRVMEICDFDEPVVVDEIGRRAWGWIEYKYPIMNDEAKKYELVPAPASVRWLRYVGQDWWGRHTYQDIYGKYWKFADPSPDRSINEERGDKIYLTMPSDDWEGEPDYPMQSEMPRKYYDDGRRHYE